MPEAIGNFIVVRTPLQMLDHRVLHQRQVFAMDARFEVAEHGGHVFGFQAEQRFDLRVVDFIGLQIPVPQAQLTGLKCQRQPRLALAQRLIGLIQLKAALDDSGFEPDLGLAQFPLGLASLFDFPRQLMVELLIVGLRLLQMLNQRLILKALDQPLADQAINLQGHDNQRHQQHQAKPAPATLLLIAMQKKKGDRGQQARHGKGQKRRDTHRVSNTGRQRRRTDQAKHPGLLLKAFHRNQGDCRTGKGQAADACAQQKHATPDRLRLTQQWRGVKRRNLDDAQTHQRRQPP